MKNNIKDIEKEQIDTTNWKEYVIGNLFDIKGSKTTSKKDLELKGIGKYPYITTTATNQGVSGYYNFYTENGNVLTFDSAVLGTCFYQEEKFSASDHVELGIPYYLKFNKEIGLFFQIIINKTNEEVYHYGHKYNQNRIKETIIKLPSIYNQETNEYEPDWKYMENYISNLLNKLKVEKIKNTINNIKSIDEIKIDITNWKDYTICDLFEVEIAKSIDKGKLKEDKNGINYITRKSTNNGLEYKVENIESLKNIGNCITMAMIGSKGTCYYQKEDFLSSQNMLIFRNENINKNIGNFISVIIEKIYKISIDYNAIKKDTVLKDKIYLPSVLNETTNEFEPDWKYMEEFINHLLSNLSK